MSSEAAISMNANNEENLSEEERTIIKQSVTQALLQFPSQPKESIEGILGHEKRVRQAGDKELTEWIVTSIIQDDFDKGRFKYVGVFSSVLSFKVTSVSILFFFLADVASTKL
jgi:hypothetical protein